MPIQNTSGNELLWRRRRARYRAWHRGMREMDLILGSYADARVDEMDEAAMLRFEELLDEMDTDLLTWVTGQIPIPDSADKPLLKEIMAHHASRTRPS